MEGKFFTRAGLGGLLVGIILLTTWTALYDEEYNVIVDGKIAKHTAKSKNLLGSAIVITMVGYALCVIGYSITTDFLDVNNLSKC